jgi:hypothetical protein
MGLHTFRDPSLTEDFEAVRLPIDVADFRTYAVDRTSDKADSSLMECRYACPRGVGHVARRIRAGGPRAATRPPCVAATVVEQSPDEGSAYESPVTESSSPSACYTRSRGSPGSRSASGNARLRGHRR